MKIFVRITLVLLLVVGLQAPAVNISLVAFAQEGDVQEQTAQNGPADAGEKGEKGDKGADGQEGQSGDEGAGGDEGSDGEDGEQGEPAQDEPAEDGDDGDSGDSGDAGDGGDAGDTGEDGDIQEDGQNGKDATDGTEGENGEDGGNGEEGEDGEDETQGDEKNSDGSVIVETGNATSAGLIQNTGNTNEVNAGGLPLCSDKTRKDDGKGGKDGLSDEGKGDKDSKGDEASQESDEDKERCFDPDLEVDNKNDGNINNDGDGQADTGNNEASDNNGDASIDTGDATGVLDIFNLLNTNIVNSDGLFVLLSNLQEQILDMDLRDWMPHLKEYNPNCSDSCYSLSDLEVLNKNLAHITNNVTVGAHTGLNNANDNTGEGLINTGDAYAGANVINFANTNIIDSNYLMFVANNFGNFFGDIVFPNASSFFSSMFSSPSKVYSETEISNTNTASVSNNVTATADTGNNEANGGDGGFIQTGDANSAVNVFNQVNMNILGGNSFVALIRVSGNWSGDVFGLPEGISWKQTPNGIMLYSDELEFQESSATDDGAPHDSTLPCDNCNNQESSGKKGGKGSKKDHTELEVANMNNATINNNVQVFALTGDNKANGNGKGGAITTGNAQAVANVVNVANTNVIGANWMFAMFNILGDFNGNISFGRPDLWIGQRAEIPNDPALPGDKLTYYLTVTNNGDAPAHDVTIKNVFDELFFSFGSSQEDSSLQENELVWSLGTLNPGQGLEVSFTGNIRNDIPFGTFAFTNKSTVQATESDNNTQDNEDSVELIVLNAEPAPSGGGGGGDGNNGGSGGGGNSGGGSGGGSSGSSDNAGTGKSVQSETAQSKKPNLTVVKTYSAPTEIYPGMSVDYTVIVSNTNGSSAYDAVLYDVLVDPDGNDVHEESWDLGEVFPDEELTITYSVIFEDDAKPGIYYNDAWVDANNGYSNTATTSIELKNNKEAFLGIQKELTRIAAEIGTIEGKLYVSPEIPQSEEGVIAKEQNGKSLAEFPLEQNPFFASLAGMLQGFGNWLMILAGASSMLLFLLLRRRKLRKVQQ